MFTIWQLDNILIVTALILFGIYAVVLGVRAIIMKIVELITLAVTRIKAKMKRNNNV